MYAKLSFVNYVAVYIDNYFLILTLTHVNQSVCLWCMYEYQEVCWPYGGNSQQY